MASLTTTPEQAPRPAKHDREDSGVALDVEQVWKLYWEAADGASPYTVLPPPTIADLPKVSVQASSSTTTLVRSGAVRKVRPKSESESVDVWVDAEEIQTSVSLEASASAPALMQTAVEQEQEQEQEEEEVPSPMSVSLPPFLPVASIQLPDSIADLEKPPPAPEDPIPEPKGQSFKSLIATKARILRNVILRRSILYDESNLLVTDPAAIDVLLLCICAVSGVRRRRRMVPFDLIPGCPISRGKVKAVVDNLPELAQLIPPTSSASRPNSSSQNNASLKTLKNEHVKLLTWVLTSSFAVLSSVTPTLNSHMILPSLLPLGIRAFAVTRQPPGRESQFARHAATGDTFPVFHGTSPARLPLILSQGLRNMSNTRFQAHGKAMGPGIYLAGDPATSLGYSYATSTWKGSQFRGSVTGTTPPQYNASFDSAPPTVPLNWERMGDGEVLCKKILLGCELAGEMRGRGTYVIKEEAKVCVRFVFLVPGGWCGEGYPGSLVNDLESVLTEMRAMR